MATALIVKSTDSNGKAYQKTVTAVNPDVSNEILATFGQKIAALSTHTYSGTDRVDKINCDTEAGGGHLTPTLTLATTTRTVAQTQGSQNTAIPITYNGDGELFAMCNSKGLFGSITTDNSGQTCLEVSVPNIQYIVTPATITVYATATDTYKAASATFTVTA